MRLTLTVPARGCAEDMHTFHRLGGSPFEFAQEDDDSPNMAALRLLVSPDSPRVPCRWTPCRQLRDADSQVMAQGVMSAPGPDFVPASQWRPDVLAMQLSDAKLYRAPRKYFSHPGTHCERVSPFDQAADADCWDVVGTRKKSRPCASLDLARGRSAERDLCSGDALGLHQSDADGPCPPAAVNFWDSGSSMTELSSRSFLQLNESDGDSPFAFGPILTSTPVGGPPSSAAGVDVVLTSAAAPWAGSEPASSQEFLGLSDIQAASPAQPEAAAPPGRSPIRTRVKAVNTTSRFRGVTKHRVTGRFEAQLWDATAVNNTRGRNARARGRQVYLGGYDSEEAAAIAYDRAAVKFLGPSARLNFQAEDYDSDAELRDSMTRVEWVTYLRSHSASCNRGMSRYRGVTRHHSKFEARISGLGNGRYKYLGSFNTEDEAARAFDMASILLKGSRAILNFPAVDYFDPDTGAIRDGLPWDTLPALPSAFGGAYAKALRNQLQNRPRRIDECA